MFQQHLDKVDILIQGDADRPPPLSIDMVVHKLLRQIVVNNGWELRLGKKKKLKKKASIAVKMSSEQSWMSRRVEEP